MYGYARTVRRAQGASLDLGGIWFDRHHFPAGRGYGYVAVSRFRSRAGVYLYGKLRQTDFLPVGPEREDEVLERGYYSLSDSDSDGPGMEYAGAGAFGHSASSSEGSEAEGGGEEAVYAFSVPPEEDAPGGAAEADAPGGAPTPPEGGAASLGLDF